MDLLMHTLSISVVLSTVIVTLTVWLHRDRASEDSRSRWEIEE